MAQATSRLRRIVLLAGAPSAVLVVAAIAFFSTRTTTSGLVRAASDGLQASAERTAALVTQYLRERRDDLQFLAQAPGVVAEAQRAGAEVRRLGLDRLATDDLERQFATTRELGGDATVRALLRNALAITDFAEIFFTEAAGLNILGTNLTSDFVQSDEPWWQAAMETGEFQGDPEFDESAGVIALEYAAQIYDAQSAQAIGALKGVIRLDRLSQLLDIGNEDVELEIVDAAGRIVLASDPTRLLATTDLVDSVPRLPEPLVATVTFAGRTPEMVASVPADNGTWWVIAREPLDLATAAAGTIQRSILVTSFVMVVATLLVLFGLTRWLDRRVTRPVVAAGTIAGRIAAGDLTVQFVGERGGSDEVGDLIGAIDRMVTSLRRLVTAIRASAQESSAMAEQISASTEEMSAGAQEMATTCQNLVLQASDQAELIKATATDAGGILAITSQLAAGTSEAVSRNAELSTLAEQHRDQLMESSRQLRRLVSDIDEGASEASRLAEMSVQILDFVTLSRRIASDTNMLALNAAIEASRAEGGEGQGFGVVADEVRKLAGQASRAATVATDTVGRVAQMIELTRDRFHRIAEGSAAVRSVAESAAQGLDEVATAAAANHQWTDEISKAADQARALVEEITVRLQALSDGTEGFASAVEQIAATAEEQTAASEEIASSASHLAEAAERLNADVSSFRLTNRSDEPGGAGPRIDPPA